MPDSIPTCGQSFSNCRAWREFPGCPARLRPGQARIWVAAVTVAPVGTASSFTAGVGRLLRTAYGTGRRPV